MSETKLCICNCEAFGVTNTCGVCGNDFTYKQERSELIKTLYCPVHKQSDAGFGMSTDHIGRMTCESCQTKGLCFNYGFCRPPEVTHTLTNEVVNRKDVKSNKTRVCICNCPSFDVYNTCGVCNERFSYTEKNNSTMVGKVFCPTDKLEVPFMDNDRSGDRTCPACKEKGFKY